MKTQNNNQESGFSQISKMVLLSSAVILSVAFISKSASAQKFWQQISTNHAYGMMASLINESASETQKTDAVFKIIDAEISSRFNHSNKTFTYEPEMEAENQVEGWMTEEALFIPVVEFTTVEAEENLSVEEWMTNSGNFTSPLAEVYVETENALEVETWMTVEELFNSTEAIESAEPALEVEAWMTDETLFSANSLVVSEETDEPLKVEQWMTYEANFNNLAVLTATGAEPSIELESWMINEDIFFEGLKLDLPRYAQNK